uniref:Uncharacterized protein n=1 Tax=Strongyloides venezuelensis TaxID=75913 RepID=A0A0K0F0W3_STRVS
MLKENRTTTENEDSWTDRLKNKEINVILCFSFIVLSIYIYLVSIMYRDILNPYDIKLIFQGNDSSTIENISEIEDFKSSILTLYFFLILSLISKSIAMKFFIPSYIGFFY